jgi:hypothetical protein
VFFSVPRFNEAQESNYGSRYFDKPAENVEDDNDDGIEEEDEFDLVSCAKDCCDNDCECDDCTRCAGKGIRIDDEEKYWTSPVAA